ncbi:MAG TPA: MogA/MoaB family molybdenum cofactor biosynthesis protein [Actinomycetota bacterium]|nr:MogA/MoaB family molybdenum cofactor biosynthesis protein [Actinomycetota bacterium]
MSDGAARGTREDRSGPAVASRLSDAGFDVVRTETVSDDRDAISSALRELAEAAGLVVTTGGTGLAPSDVTPEATRDVIEREVPGLAEAMRSAGRASVPTADLSRGLAGTVGSTLVVNVPGSERGAVESLGAVLEALPHALDVLAGETGHGE